MIAQRKWTTDQRLSFLAMLGTWAAVVVVLVAVYFQNRATRELHSQQLFLQFYSQWESEDMQRRRGELASTLLADPNRVDIDDAPLVFLETVAHSTRRGLLDRDLVWTTFSVDTSNYWLATQKYIAHVRQTEADPELFEELEWMHTSFMAELAQHTGAKGSLIGRDADSVRRFLEWEARRK
jgi:hypothetical protein